MILSEFFNKKCTRTKLSTNQRPDQPKLSLPQNPPGINAFFVEMNLDHFRVHSCVDLYLPIIIPPIIADTRYEQAPVVKNPVNNDVLSLHLSSCVMLKSTSFSLV